MSSLAKVTAALPHGEARRGQADMAEAVARAVEGGRHLVVQAGTGTGKSLAYLVPTVLSGRTTVIATATGSPPISATMNQSRSKTSCSSCAYVSRSPEP